MCPTGAVSNVALHVWRGRRGTHNTTARTRAPHGSQFRQSIVPFSVHRGRLRQWRHNMSLGRVTQRMAVQEVRVLVRRQRQGVLDLQRGRSLLLVWRRVSILRRAL